ncbi:DVU_1553 family AMP-dependent CoA ligase [Desulfospira joergensenii]|uniref:DVU_1553 family AMP-dependent CoA ligase n=1 Tax=Desulfospira joergensenii TaxID=53329 RepID=UPI0003B5044C|nr:AMP-binding protein [Desulfospira joergensenii]
MNQLPTAFLDAWQWEKIRFQFPGEKSRETLERYQWSAIQKLLGHVMENSPFYRDHFRDHHPKSLKGYLDFSSLPFTFPGHVRKKPMKFLCVPQDRISRIVTLETSGTTGRPKRIFFTDQDLEKTIEFFRIVISRLTRPKDRVLVLLPGQTPGSAGDLLKTAMDGIGVKAKIFGLITDGSGALETVRQLSPSLIIGLPVQILALAQFMAREKLRAPLLSHVILTSDQVSSALKNRVANLLDCRVFDHYGLTETGFGGGIDCFAHQGYHLREVDLFFEIVDPDTGRPLPPGKWGEVAVTTLTRTGMPLIRYRTGDMSRFLKDPCACGSLFRRMDYVCGRRAHTLPLSSGQTLAMADVDALFFRIPGVVDVQASLVSGSTPPVLDIFLKIIDNSRIRADLVRQCLDFSPRLKQAVETGALALGSLQTRPFGFTDTYQGKRLIQTRNKEEADP